MKAWTRANSLNTNEGLNSVVKGCLTFKLECTCLQKATILENDYEEASASLNKKFNTTADARERAARLAKKADKILQDTLKQKGDLQGEGSDNSCSLHKRC